LEYLQALEYLPDHITLAVNIEGLYDGNQNWSLGSGHVPTYTNRLISLPFTAKSEEAKYVGRLIDSQRSKDFRRVVPRKLEWNKLCKWMPNAFAFPDLSIDAWEERNEEGDPNTYSMDDDFVNKTQAVAIENLQKAWLAYRRGDAVAFKKSKEKLLKLWKKWIAKIGDSID
jgi:hypothetical protein